MIPTPTPLDKLRIDGDLQEWWQGVLSHPNYALIVDAVKVYLEQEPPKVPDGNTVMEMLGLAQAANLGARGALAALDRMGARAMAEVRVAEAKGQARQAPFNPAAAGTRYGERVVAAEKGTAPSPPNA
jgi:hypothetical protein